MGGVYTLGDNRGTRVIGNAIHDILSYDMTGGGSCGIYMDEGSRGVTCVSNVIWRTNTTGINQHYGRENVYSDNVVVEPTSATSPQPITVHRYDPPLAASFSNNVIYTSGKCPVFNRGVSMNSNTWDDVVRVGNVVRRLEDFVPPGRGAAGVYGDAAWVAAADAIRPLPVQNPPMPPCFESLTEYSTGFEAWGEGGYLPDNFGRQSMVNDYDSMRVTARVAATGGRSLAVHDEPSLTFDHLPHFCRALSATNGMAEIFFTVRLEEGVRMQFECRDWHPVARAEPNRFYAVAARLQFENGQVLASLSGDGGTAVCPYRPNTWLKCRLRAFALGSGSSRYEFTVTDEDGAVRRVAGTSYERQADCLHWFGFMTPGKSGKYWYVDDVGWSVRPEVRQPADEGRNGTKAGR